MIDDERWRSLSVENVGECRLDNVLNVNNTKFVYQCCKQTYLVEERAVSTRVNVSNKGL